MEDINDQRLHKAIEVLDEQLIRSLLENGVNLKVTNSSGMNCLHLAVKRRCLDIVKLLLDADQSIVNEVVVYRKRKSEDIDGYTALHLSAKMNDIEIGKLLLSHGAKVDVAGRRKWMPLHVASFYGNTGFVNLLLDNNAPIDAEADGKTALMFAVERNNLDTVLFLLSNGVMIKGDSELVKLLELAVINLSVSVVKMLLDLYTTDLNKPLKYGVTFLHRCLLPEVMTSDNTFSKQSDLNTTEENLKLKMIKMFVEKNVDVKAVCDKGLTVLHIAVALNYYKIAQYLLNIDDEFINMKSNNGKTPLVYAVEYSNVKMVKLLLSAEAKVNICNLNGKSLIEIAIEKNCEEIVKLLLKSSKNLKLFNKMWIEALKCGIEIKNVDLIDKLLITLSISVCRDEESNVAEVRKVNKISMIVAELLINNDYIIKFVNTEAVLHFAVVHKYNKILNYCLQEGVDVNCTNIDGNSLLYMLCSVENLKAVKKCIDLGCDVNMRNRLGATALHIAVQSGKTALVRVLTEAGSDINAKNEDLEVPFFVFLKNLEPFDDKSSVWLESKIRNIMRIAEMLLRPGCDLNCHENSVSCILYLAVKTGLYELVKMTYKYHPFLDHVDESKGQTCLHLSVERDCFYNSSDHDSNITRFLLMSGANPDIRDAQEEIPLTIAIKRNYREKVKDLVRFSNWSAYRDADMKTVMHLAVKQMSLDAVCVLMLAGVDLHVKDAFGKTPMCYATANEGIGKLLLDMGYNVNLLCPKDSDCSCWKNVKFQYYFKKHVLMLYFVKCNLNSEITSFVESLVTENPDVYEHISTEATKLSTSLIPGTNIPFINLLKFDDKKWANYVRNENVGRVFRQEILLEKQWPSYWSLLVTNWRQGHIRKRLVERCYVILKSVLMSRQIILPRTCISLIFDHLETCELNALIISFPFENENYFSW